MNFRSAFLATLLVIALSAAAAITAEEEMPQANAHLATARSVKSNTRRLQASTKAPTASPTKSPTASPTKSPTKSPTASPTVSPTASPIVSTGECSGFVTKKKCKKNKKKGCFWKGKKNGECLKLDPESCPGYVTKKICKSNGCKWKKKECSAPKPKKPKKTKKPKML